MSIKMMIKMRKYKNSTMMNTNCKKKLYRNKIPLNTRK